MCWLEDNHSGSTLKGRMEGTSWIFMIFFVFLVIKQSNKWINLDDCHKLWEKATFFFQLNEAEHVKHPGHCLLDLSNILSFVLFLIDKIEIEFYSP